MLLAGPALGPPPLPAWRAWAQCCTWATATGWVVVGVLSARSKAGAWRGQVAGPRCFVQPCVLAAVCR